MSFDWSTAILEIVNFLILLWILKRFLYRPVLNIVARRQEGIEQALRQAAESETQAQALQDRYEDRLADWEREKSAARHDFQRDLEAERAQALADLDRELQDLRQKARSAEQRRQEQQAHDAEIHALELASRWASRLLGELSGPELHQRLLDMSVDQLGNLTAERKQLLLDGLGKTRQVEIVSAYPLSTAQHDQLEQAFSSLFDQPISLRPEVDPQLQAGLRITAGPWLMQANIADELRAFTDTAAASTHAG